MFVGLGPWRCDAARDRWALPVEEWAVHLEKSNPTLFIYSYHPTHVFESAFDSNNQESLWSVINPTGVSYCSDCLLCPAIRGDDDEDSIACFPTS